MSKVAIQGNASGTGVFTLAAPNSNTDRTLTLPDEAGTIITSGSPTVLPKGGPVFKAYLYNGNSSYSIPASTYTKIPFDTIEFDTNSFFDNTTNYRFQPTIAGYYSITVSVYYSYTSAIGTYVITAIYKNGSSIARQFPYVPTGGVYGIFLTNTLTYLNGSTDYIEGYAWSNATGPTLVPLSYNTYITGHLVRAD